VLDLYALESRAVPFPTLCTVASATSLSVYSVYCSLRIHLTIIPTIAALYIEYSPIAPCPLYSTESNSFDPVLSSMQKIQLLAQQGMVESLKRSWQGWQGEQGTWVLLLVHLDHITEKNWCSSMQILAVDVLALQLGIENVLFRREEVLGFA